MHESPKAQTTFGYLTAVESPDHGYFGGYLVISPIGRPLEFHCTAPVRASRAQRILYGPTLGAFLLAEQIGGALLAAAKLSPNLLLTDHPDFGTLRDQFPMPILLVQQAQNSTQVSQWPAAASHNAERASIATGVRDQSTPQGWSWVSQRGDFLLQVPCGFEADMSQVDPLVSRLQERVDLLEPFGRIHEAICEAQRIGARSPEANGNAA